MPETKNSLTRLLFKSGFLLFLGLLLELVISFGAKVLMAQLLGAPEYGVATIGITTLSFASTVLLFGMNTGVGRYLPRFDDTADRKGVLLSAFQISLGVSIAAGVTLFLLAEAIASGLLGTPEVAMVLKIAAIGIPFAVLLKLTIGVIQGMKHSVPKVLIRNIAQPIVRIGLISAALYLGLGATGILGAYTLTFAIAGLGGLYYVVTRTDIRASASGRMRRRELLTFSAPLMLMATMLMVLSYFDIFLLSYFRSPGDVGTYNVIYPIAELLTATLSAFGFIVMPIVSELHADGARDEMQRTYQIVTKWIFALTLPAALVIILFPTLTIRLTFGAEYAWAGTSLSVLALGFFTHAVAGPNVNTLTSIGRTRTIMWDNLLAGGTNIALNLLLIPRLGLLGAAVATTVSYAGLNVLYSVQLYRETGIHPFSTALMKPAVAGTVAMLVIYVAVTEFFGVSLLVLVGTFSAFLLIYGIALLALGGVEEEEVLLVLSFEERFGVNLGPLKRVAWLFLDNDDL